MDTQVIKIRISKKLPPKLVFSEFTDLTNCYLIQNFVIIKYKINEMSKLQERIAKINENLAKFSKQARKVRANAKRAKRNQKKHARKARAKSRKEKMRMDEAILKSQDEAQGKGKKPSYTSYARS